MKMRRNRGAESALRAAPIRLAIALAVTSGWFAACDSVEPEVPQPSEQRAIVSDPATLGGTAGQQAPAGPLAADGSQGDLVYVSLPPGSLASATEIEIRNPAQGVAEFIPIVDGGFDPVAIPGAVGDELHFRAVEGSVEIAEWIEVVPMRSPPFVVRTSPPKGKRDVPVALSISVVFSEPIDGATVMPDNIRLLRAGTALPGTLELAEDGLTLVLELTGSLSPGSEYVLHVDEGVADLDGDPLGQAVVIEFTTGSSVALELGRVDGDGQTVAVGSTLTLVAEVVPRLSGVPVSWTVTSGGGTIAPRMEQTDTGGYAAADWTLGPALGTQTAEVIVAGALGSPATFTATAVANPATEPVASVTVAPGSVTVMPGGTAWLTAILRDAAGQELSGRTVAWSSEDASVMEVDQDGIATALGQGTVSVTATSDGITGSAEITVGSVALAGVSAGGPEDETFVDDGAITCGLATGGAVYCWGHSLVYEFRSPEWGPFPAHISGDLEFASVDAGAYHVCGLTTSGEAYCWGDDHYGRLGRGWSGEFSPLPVAVEGAHDFGQLSAGHVHTCALTGGGVAYCWGGFNRSSVPELVPGNLQFSTVEAGGYHVCALDQAGVAYCWGDNSSNQLGDGTTTERWVPAPVNGNPPPFVSLSAGTRHTCALTGAGLTYCWGLVWRDGSSPAEEWHASTPELLQGAPDFTAISSGSDHTCGLTADGAAHCFGVNWFGELGDGSATPSVSPAPVAVSGGLTFSSLTTGSYHTCGATTGGVAYCWGMNDAGQLGNGTTTHSSVPVRVSGQP